MECYKCGAKEWIRHCPSCGEDFCDECSKYEFDGSFGPANGAYVCPNGCGEVLDLHFESIPEED